ncbi:hypothetical protein RZS08_24695, partial [Arthrospira platensis SPKY1]|nr:hypothetical protein [Arthrospira platensis SPKY1]
GGGEAGSPAHLRRVAPELPFAGQQHLLDHHLPAVLNRAGQVAAAGEADRRPGAAGGADAEAGRLVVQISTARRHQLGEQPVGRIAPPLLAGGKSLLGGGL